MRRISVILFALVLAVPVSTANWGWRGTNEPDTVYDTTAYMWHEPDTSPDKSVRKIYFNGFNRGLRETGYNTNVGFLGTAIQPPVTGQGVLLGFWKDCNDDGYIGLAEGAAFEYRPELLLGKTICGAQTPSTSDSVYPHNDGTWIREMIIIGPKKGVGPMSNNPTVFSSDEAGVWADFGTPGAPPTLLCPGGNRGIRSTGAILEFADCNTYFRTVRTLNQVDPSGNLVGGWEAEDVDNSPSPLNIDNPAYPYLYGPAEPEGHPQEGDFRGYNGGLLSRDGPSPDNRRTRAFTLVDCDSDSVSPSTDVNTPGDVTDPATYPSFYEPLNDTYEVATQSHGQDGSNVCDPQSTSDEGAAYPNIEGYDEPTFASDGRDQVDWSFEFSPGSRNFPSTAVSGNCRTNQAYTRGPLGYCTPADAGLYVERDEGPIGGTWRMNAITNTYGITLREGLRSDNPDFGATYVTFYANVGAPALAIGDAPGSLPGIYGSEACQGATTGVRNGWNCDENAWALRCVDPELQTQSELCYKVGRAYNVRDVDCWDNTLVRGSGVRAGLADLSSTGPCRDNPTNDGVWIPDLV